jgi:hypothetical protein
MKPDYIIGLDLGQARDYTALAVIERPPRIPDCRDKPVYSLRHLQRFPLNTPYTTIVPAVAALTSVPPLKGSPLVIDHTGVGRALVDMFKYAPTGCWIIPVTITAGQAITEPEHGHFHVPKKELVTCLQLILQARRIHIARSLPESDTLVQELENFRVKITPAANETFGAWREGDHDDLVLAVVMACWWAERSPRWLPSDIKVPKNDDHLWTPSDRRRGNILSQYPPGVFEDD